MTVRIEESWKKLLTDEFEKPYFNALTEFVKHEYQTTRIFPPGSLIFNAFDQCPAHHVKVVIIGQDPYHGFGQAHGLCFSVKQGIPMPPSLINIFKEIKDDLHKTMPTNGDLTRWAKQGVLLLNATLTVREGMAGSHQGKGWEIFTDAVIEKINEFNRSIVFMLWGAYAQKKGAIINRSRHLVLESVHPSPLSAHRGFLGCRHFSKANQFLVEKGYTTIDW